MGARIEDYAMIGDCETAALVQRDGSLDWLCLPRFDSGACFACLLGRPDHGRWLIAPEGETRSIRRSYRDNTLILETTFETADGEVTLIDFMPMRTRLPVLVRIVRGKSGQVPMRVHLVIRFDYGAIMPWVTRLPEGGLRAVAGPDALRLRTLVPLHGEKDTTVGQFVVSAGEEIPFVLSWHPSNEPPAPDINPFASLEQTEQWWQKWASQCTYEGRWRQPVLRSLLTLKALQYAPTGGLAAAATTSLPERLGGMRNWDYRYCWMRDATFVLYSLLSCGYRQEALAWREWLLRAVAGHPALLQIMYGLAGERRLTEWEVDWLPGYECSRPVRVGNAASKQFQLDVYGEMLATMFLSRCQGLEEEQEEWAVERGLLDFLETAWQQPDEGIWEVRGPRRHFTHSKMMAWVAFDRGIKAIEQFGLEGPVERWRALRAQIHQQVCTQGFDTELNSFVQHYGSKHLDASLLMMPLVGFLPAKDSRVQGTVAAIEKDLLRDGYVLRYSSDRTVDGLPEGEGAFLPCTFWLADNYNLQGRTEEAEKVFERLLGLCNDVGLLAEEYDPHLRRQLGNFPQAFTHVGLINTALHLPPWDSPTEQRGKGEDG